MPEPLLHLEFCLDAGLPKKNALICGMGEHTLHETGEMVVNKALDRHKKGVHQHGSSIFEISCPPLAACCRRAIDCD